MNRIWKISLILLDIQILLPLSWNSTDCISGRDFATDLNPSSLNADVDIGMIKSFLSCNFFNMSKTSTQNHIWFTMMLDKLNSLLITSNRSGWEIIDTWLRTKIYRVVGSIPEAAHASNFSTPDCKKINWARSVRVIVICSVHRLL